MIFDKLPEDVTVSFDMVSPIYQEQLIATYRAIIRYGWDTFCVNQATETADFFLSIKEKDGKYENCYQIASENPELFMKHIDSFLDPYFKIYQDDVMVFLNFIKIKGISPIGDMDLERFLEVRGYIKHIFYKFLIEKTPAKLGIGSDVLKKQLENKPEMSFAEKLQLHIIYDNQNKDE